MSFIKEVIEDGEYFYESMFYGARKEYRFDGINGPIIGIHGTGGSGWVRGGLRSFMKTTNSKGVLMMLDYQTKSVDSYLPKLSEEIKRYKNPTIVGFSSGGFIALRWAQMNGWNMINKIITIATPLQGSPKLFSFLGPMIRETLADTPKFNEILNLNPPEGKVISLFSKEDKFIPNPHNIKLNWPKIITNAKSHGDIQNHQKWFENELKEAINFHQQ